MINTEINNDGIGENNENNPNTAQNNQTNTFEVKTTIDEKNKQTMHQQSTNKRKLNSYD